MLLYINDNKTVGDLQEKFNECFPNLKIEFYDKRHPWGSSSREDHRIAPDTKLQQLRKNHNNNVFEIKSFFKTGEVEQYFRHHFGLFAQIFFRSGNGWIESVASDNATLAQLNEMVNS